MKTKSVGIIAEYNPFHKGHAYHLAKSKEMTGAKVAVAAMSGDVVQRGGFAMADKWLRAEAAVRCGVDLVVEIPAVFACNSAQYFARGGVEILENLGADYISFGSESGNIDELKDIARAIAESQEMDKAIKEGCKAGLTYPRARFEVAASILGEEKAKILEGSNNILALEYLKNIKRAEPVTFRRMGPGYNDLETQEEIASATAIRYLLAEHKDVSNLLPHEAIDVFSGAIAGGQGLSQEALFLLICQKALSMEAEKLDSINAGGEGLGNKLKNSIRQVTSYEALVDELKSKRYTRTRIERFLMQVLLGITGPVPRHSYIRVLAFNQKGSAYLKEVKNLGISGLPIITNINKDLGEYFDKNFGLDHEGANQVREMIAKDILASDLFNLACGRDLYNFSEFVRRPFIL